MPTYEYACESCGWHFEKEQRMSDAPLTDCPKCGKSIKRLISQGNFILKGGGWYAQGYGSSGSAKSSECGTKPACEGCPSAAK